MGTEKRLLHTRLTVTLPTFVVIALRYMVKSENAGRSPESRWTVSLLLESWLLEAFTKEDLSKVQKASPEFRAAATAWMRWMGKRIRERSK